MSRPYPTAILATLVGIALLPLMPGVAQARVLLPVDTFGLLGQANEFANVGFMEFGTKASQASWGRGIEAGIEVHDACNRNDKHAISSWVGIDVFDSTSSSATYTKFHQMGWDQNWVDQGCKEARVFGQTCTSPCAANSDYLPIEIWSTHQVPNDGLPGHFRVVVATIGSPGPSGPCILRMELVAADAGPSCPIVMTQSEFQEKSCEAANYMAADFVQATGDVECDVASEEAQQIASFQDECQDETFALLADLLPFCQAVDAAVLIRDGAVPLCGRPTSPLDPVLDSPLCLIGDGPDPEPSPALTVTAQAGCEARFYYDKTQMAPKAPQLTDCAVAKNARVEYEAADDAGFAHSGPGSDDQPTQYTQWSYVGNTGTSLIDKASIDGNFYADNRASCPTYEGRYKTSSNLVNFVEVGPHIDGSTNWCGEEDVDATPGPGILIGVLAAGGAVALLARRRRA